MNSPWRKWYPSSLAQLRLTPRTEEHQEVATGPIFARRRQFLIEKLKGWVLSEEMVELSGEPPLVITQLRPS